MIVDTSALLAILFRESGYEALVEHLLAAERAGIGTPTLAEAALVLTGRLSADPQGTLERFLQEFEIVPIPFGLDHWRTAADAYHRYGKGRHPARLNFGDCMSYAVARLANAPLLFVGNDFTQTDLEAV